MISAYEGINLVPLNNDVRCTNNDKHREADETFSKFTPSLLDALEKLRVPKRQKDKPLRMPIAICHKISGKGYVLCGRVDSGKLSSPGT